MLSITISRQKLYIVALLAFAATLIFAFWSPGQNNTNSPLTRQIQTYRDTHDSENIIDLTSVLQDHIRLGMTEHEVTEFFQKMGFEIHRNHRDKNTLVADYRSSVGPKFAHVVQIDRVILHFESEKLKSFEGKSYTESP